MGINSICSAEYMHEDEVTAQHIDVLGPMPSEWWQRWEGRPPFFNDYGGPTESYKRNKWPPLEERSEICIQKWRWKFVGSEIKEDEKAAFLDLMLSFRPEERPTAEEVLMSDLMVKWALPDCERC